MLQQPPGQGGVEPVARFAVNADHLLLVGHDARLDAGGAGAALSNPRQPMCVFAQQALELAGGQVAAHGAEQFRRHPQGGQVARHVGRAAGHEALVLEIQHRHGRFRRNARHAAPDEMVEHGVADHQDAGLVRAGQDLADARSREFSVVHVGSSHG